MSDDLDDELDRLLGRDQSAPRPRTVLVLPGLRPDPVARICGMLGARGHLAPQPGCLLVVLDPPEADDPQSTQEIVQRLSASLRRVQLLRVEEKDSYLAVEVWQRGKVVDTPPAGVVAQQFPDPVLGLVHGTTEPASLPSSRPIITGDGDGGGLLRRILGR